ncbi:Uncharacterised protein [uncultured archaeon]|nr:Uncharacterised protein [uncultured archaeon]
MPQVHAKAHPLAGKTVKILKGDFKGEEYRLEDWWDRVSGESWMNCEGNPACIEYALRSSGLRNKEDATPIDNNVVYGKIGAFGKLMHVSTLDTLG